MTDLTPIRREVLVEAGPDVAFRVFTEGIGRWWPLAELSVHGAGSSVSFESGELVERSPSGERAVWGTVTAWEPGRLVAFTWHPGRDPECASAVKVTFREQQPGTLVILEHTGWEHFTDPAVAREEYGNGWPMVLRRYQDVVGRAGETPGGAGAPGGPRTGAGEGEQTWVALLHRPGPSAPAEGSLFADPRFAEHVAFLNRMQAAGYLVAAGPMPDAEGEGMTILRLPGSGALAEATRLATEDDGAVAGGFLTVTIRPWQVLLEASR
jgi:uncharacterized protein YciI/uncharacterized protein YndB with AHSA1/START domain